MSKNFNNKNINGNKPPEDTNINVVKHVLSDGTEVTLRQVSRFLVDRLQASRKIPEPPTYEVTLVDNTKQVMIHDESTISTPDDKLIWDKYILDRKIEEAEFSQKFYKLMIFEGVDVSEEKLRDDASWIKRQKYLGIDNIPDDEFERKYHYINTEVMKTDSDMIELISTIMTLNGLNREVVDDIRKSFRTTIQGD